MTRITSRQRRANDRRRYWADYPAWLERRRTGTGAVGNLVVHLLERIGHARAAYRAEQDYQRLKRLAARRDPQTTRRTR